jgi:hypothetical protein
MKEYICGCCQHEFTLMAWESRACPECRTAFKDEADENIKNMTNTESVEKALIDLRENGICEESVDRELELKPPPSQFVRQDNSGAWREVPVGVPITTTDIPGRSGISKFVAQNGKITKVPVLDRRSGCAPEDVPVVGYADNFREKDGKVACDTHVDPAKLGEDKTVLDFRLLAGSGAEGFWKQPSREIKSFVHTDLNAALIDTEKAVREGEIIEWKAYRNMLITHLGLEARQADEYIDHIRCCINAGKDMVGKVICLSMSISDILFRLADVGIVLPDDHKLKKQLRLNAAIADIRDQSQKPYLFDLQEAEKWEKEGKLKNPIPMANGTLLIPDEKTLEDKAGSADDSLVAEPVNLDAAMEKAGKELREHQRRLEEEEGYADKIRKQAAGTSRPFRVNRYTKMTLSSEEQAKLNSSKSSEMPLGDPRVLEELAAQKLRDMRVSMELDASEEVRKAAGLSRPESPDDPIIKNDYYPTPEGNAFVPQTQKAIDGDYFGSPALSDPSLKRGPSEGMEAIMKKTLDEMIHEYLDHHRVRETNDPALRRFFTGSISRDTLIRSFLEEWRLGGFPSFEACLLEIILKQYKELHRLQSEVFKYHESLSPNPLKNKT